MIETQRSPDSLPTLKGRVSLSPELMIANISLYFDIGSIRNALGQIAIKNSCHLDVGRIGIIKLAYALNISYRDYYEGF